MGFSPAYALSLSSAQSVLGATESIANGTVACFSADCHKTRSGHHRRLHLSSLLSSSSPRLVPTASQYPRFRPVNRKATRRNITILMRLFLHLSKAYQLVRQAYCHALRQCHRVAPVLMCLGQSTLRHALNACSRGRVRSSSRLPMRADQRRRLRATGR